MVKKHNLLIQSKVKPFYVYDGKRHPVKSVAREKRDGHEEDALSWLNQFYQKGHDNEPLTTKDREQAKKDWKTITVWDTGMIHMVVECGVATC
jgi:hypothetical protein